MFFLVKKLKVFWFRLSLQSNGNMWFVCLLIKSWRVFFGGVQDANEMLTRIRPCLKWKVEGSVLIPQRWVFTKSAKKCLHIIGEKHENQFLFRIPVFLKKNHVAQCLRSLLSSCWSSLSHWNFALENPKTSSKLYLPPLLGVDPKNISPKLLPETAVVLIKPGKCVWKSWGFMAVRTT